MRATSTLTTLIGAAGAVRLDAPVEPESDEARRLILDELSKPQYAAAQPTWFDQLASAVWDWLTNLRLEGATIEFGLMALVVAVVVGVIVAAFLLFGVPRMRRRSAVTGPLFGVDERRTSDELRAAARAAARAEDWSTAIEEHFRAIARSLQERTVFTPAPGTTAQGFARAATESFPEHAVDLRSAATAFDDVRYLEHEGTREQYEALVELDRTLEGTAPILRRRERVPA